VVLMPTRSSAGGGDHKSMHATLARQDLLLLGPGHCFRDQVLRFCPECNRLSVSSDNMQRTLEGSSLETIRLMVATGIGITVLPYTSVSGYAYPSDLLSVRPFEAPAPTRMVALAWRKSFQPNSSGWKPTSGSNRSRPSRNPSASAARSVRWPTLRPGRGALP
jgi:DNA-binding transcriptional LysR family regulator